MHYFRVCWFLLVASGWGLAAAPGFAALTVYAPTYDANSSNSTITSFNAAGTPSVFADTSPSFVQFPKLGPDGKLYVSYLDGFIHRFSAAGVDLGAFNTLGLAGVYGTAFDSSGNVYAASGPFSGVTTIYKFTPTGAIAPGFINGFAKDLNGDSIYGIAFGPNGDLYAASDSGVLHFSSTGVNLGVFDAPPAGSPVDLAFDGLGKLFVANFGGNEIREFSSAGVDLGQFVSVNAPTGLAFGPGGNLFVVSLDPSQGTSTIKEFTPSGVEVPFTVADIATQSGFTFGLAVAPQAAVPEPCTLLMFGSGLLGMAIFGVRRSRRRSRQRATVATQSVGRIAKRCP